MQRTFLKQRRGILTIEAEILPDGVRYRESGFLRSHDSKVRFEYIPDDVSRLFHVNRLYLVISVFFGLLFLFRLIGFVATDEVTRDALLWSVGWFVVAAGGTWMQSPRYVGYLVPGSALLFFDQSGSGSPGQFLERVQQAKLQYFHARYGPGREAVNDSSRPPDHHSQASAPPVVN